MTLGVVFWGKSRLGVISYQNAGCIAVFIRFAAIVSFHFPEPSIDDRNFCIDNSAFFDDFLPFLVIFVLWQEGNRG